MLKYILIYLAVFFTIQIAASQDTTIVKRKIDITGYFLGAGLITTGIIVNKDQTKRDFRDWVRKRTDVKQSSLDDILQHTPVFMLYLGDLATKKSGQEVARQTRHLLVSQGMTLATVWALKSAVNATRPNGGPRSFPSGHTAYAMAGANVLYHSFKDDNLWLAYSGYLPAIVTGVYRILKDKHWISDVLTGAGIGILFSHFSYQFDIWNSRTRHVTHDPARVQISMGVGPGGVGMAVQF